MKVWHFNKGETVGYWNWEKYLEITVGLAPKLQNVISVGGEQKTTGTQKKTYKN